MVDLGQKKADTCLPFFIPQISTGWRAISLLFLQFRILLRAVFLFPDTCLPFLYPNLHLCRAVFVSFFTQGQLFRIKKSAVQK
ncbi:MAG TPA: hypothetical protein DCX41_06145 [Aequorivita sp.]|nr:hypothetical protein [Aequorivita sp.]HBL79156.1 hypothetical protein [Aequorivita sp.]